MAPRLALLLCSRRVLNANSESVMYVLENKPVRPSETGNYVDTLVDIGIVTEITGRQRDRVYAYPAYLSILNEGAEPF